jgi:hypothetical protein
MLRIFFLTFLEGVRKDQDSLYLRYSSHLERSNRLQSGGAFPLDEKATLLGKTLPPLL